MGVWQSWLLLLLACCLGPGNLAHAQTTSFSLLEQYADAERYTTDGEGKTAAFLDWAATLGMGSDEGFKGLIEFFLREL